MSMGVQGSNGEYSKSIELPVGANLLYLQGSKDKKEIRLLAKYANKEMYTDKDFEDIFNLFITNIPRPSISTLNSNDFLSDFGVEMVKNKEDEFEFKLIDEYIPYTRVTTWECIALDLLSESYMRIINNYDFGDIHIDLGSWKTEIDEMKQSLLNALRNGLMFTIIGFLYGDNRNLYESFNDFFDNEFSKRVSFINAMWKTRNLDEKIRYLPIFDSFYNLKGLQANTLIEVIHAILDNTEIITDDKEMIRNTLIDGAEGFHKNIDGEGRVIEQEIIKPAVNYLIEIQTATADLDASQILYDNRLYNQSVNRSYYALMHSLKALLEKERMLADWVPNVLNVDENHKKLETKLVNLVNKRIIEHQYLADFRYVKQQRWIADYNIAIIEDIVSNDCINRATNFVKEIKRITL
jgi:uncharacterized protein (UPF0332 family)